MFVMVKAGRIPPFLISHDGAGSEESRPPAKGRARHTMLIFFFSLCKNAAHVSEPSPYQ